MYSEYIRVVDHTVLSAGFSILCTGNSQYTYCRVHNLCPWTGFLFPVNSRTYYGLYTVSFFTYPCSVHFQWSFLVHRAPGNCLLPIQQKFILQVKEVLHAFQLKPVRSDRKYDEIVKLMQKNFSWKRAVKTEHNKYIRGFLTDTGPGFLTVWPGDFFRVCHGFPGFHILLVFSITPNWLEGECMRRKHVSVGWF